MTKRAELKPIRIGRQTGLGRWKIELPRTISSSGKRERYFFATRADAEGFAQSQRKSLSLYGAQGSGILSPAAQEQSKVAIEALKPFGVPLNQVVQDWISQRRTRQKSITFGAAMDAFTASAQRSSSYPVSLRQTRNRLQVFHGRLMCDITPDEVAAALGGMTDAVCNFTIRILGGVFMYFAEAALILRTAANHDRELLRFLVVSLFCGIRRTEVIRLHWSAFP